MPFLTSSEVYQLINLIPAANEHLVDTYHGNFAVLKREHFSQLKDKVKMLNSN